MTPPPFRTRLRAARMGLSTVLGAARRGWFIPYRYADTVRTPTDYPALTGLFRDRTPAFAEFLGVIDRYAAALEAIGADPPPQPRWTQGWFPRLDAAAAYAMVRSRRPARIVEIGSGHSTRFMARAIADERLTVAFTAIDPAPRAGIADLGIDHVAATVHEAPPGLFADLGPGDMLFVDSSHILMPGSDVDYLINTVWPSLPAGVLVHVHDICLPDGYPKDWTWRGYNEQLAIAPLLASGGAGLLFASRFVATRMADAVANTVVGRLPILDVAIETGLWIEKS